MSNSNYSDSDNFYFKLLGLMVSDTVVYVVLLAPLVVAIINFTAGNCIVSEIYSITRRRSSRHSKSFYQRVGRACISAVLISFFCQYYVYFHTAHSSWNGTVYQCSPIDITLAIMGCLGSGHNSFSYFVTGLECRKEDVLYLILWISFLVVYLRVVWSDPSSKHKGKKRKDSSSDSLSKEVKASFCRYCKRHVIEMDHHCFLVDNCIGHNNRVLFLVLLGISVLQLSFFVGICAPYCFSGYPVLLSVFGIFLAGAALLFLSCFLFFHLILWKKKLTTKSCIRKISIRKRKRIEIPIC